MNMNRFTRGSRITVISVVVLLLLIIAFASAAPRVSVVHKTPKDVSDAEAQPILEQLKTLGNLDEIYMEKSDDDRIIVYATAFIDLADPSPIASAKRTAQQVITAVYRSRARVANATVLVTRGGRPLLGASLGAEALRSSSISVLSADSSDAFASFLSSINRDDPQHLERSTWLEIDETAAQ
ncbi:MAG: hypothetical protein IRY98_00335 [Alicyclobacillaceae bacterium]|nr:hypothetical protein [Alicyclobacillaceae bacterium]